MHTTSSFIPGNTRRFVHPDVHISLSLISTCCTLTLRGHVYVDQSDCCALSKVRVCFCTACVHMQLSSVPLILAAVAWDLLTVCRVFVHNFPFPVLNILSSVEIHLLHRVAGFGSSTRGVWGRRQKISCYR
jgi:hypothetical protein